MYIIQYFRAQNALYEDFKKLTLLLWSTVLSMIIQYRSSFFFHLKLFVLYVYARSVPFRPAVSQPPPHTSYDGDLDSATQRHIVQGIRHHGSRSDAASNRHMKGESTYCEIHCKQSALDEVCFCAKLGTFGNHSLTTMAHFDVPSL